MADRPRRFRQIPAIVGASGGVPEGEQDAVRQGGVPGNRNIEAVAYRPTPSEVTSVVLTTP